MIWRPSRRTELQARAGERYGSFSFTGSFEHQLNPDFSVSASVYDTVTSFGRVLVSDLNNLPTAFQTRRNPLSPGLGGFGGCVFGDEAGTGVCLDDALQSISNRTFRNRGANLLVSGRRGLWGFGMGAGYAHRKYHTPVGGTLSGFERRTDESFTLYANGTRTLSRTASFGLDAYAGWYDSNQIGSDSAFGAGISGSYNQTFLLDRLEGYAAAGLFTTDSGEFDSTGAAGLVGLRYNFR